MCYQAAGLADLAPSSLSVGLPSSLGFSLEHDPLGGGELELFMDPAKKRRLRVSTEFVAR